MPDYVYLRVGLPLIAHWSVLSTLFTGPALSIHVVGNWWSILADSYLSYLNG